MSCTDSPHGTQGARAVALDGADGEAKASRYLFARHTLCGELETLQLPRSDAAHAALPCRSDSHIIPLHRALPQLHALRFTVGEVLRARYSARDFARAQSTQ